MSPFRMTSALEDEEVKALHVACKTQLVLWTDRLRAEVGDGFPDKVTAFRPEMAVHGKYNEACPRCGTTIVKMRAAGRGTYVCPRCQRAPRRPAAR